MYDLIIKSIMTIEEQTRSELKKQNINRTNCYELFGYDILLDTDLNPWLLEVNLSPSLAFDTPLDLKIKANLLKDMFNLIGVKMPQEKSRVEINQTFSATGWSVPFTSDFESSALRRNIIDPMIEKS